MKQIRIFLAPIIMPLISKRYFRFNNESLLYCTHRHQVTWSNERAIEIPIAQYFLEQCRDGEVLEIGNVLSYYQPIQHTVIDKYERGSKNLNLDAATFDLPERFDLILSISTFEHIGYDDEGEGSAHKILEAIRNCKKHLKPNGKMVLTVPIGYNPSMDSLLREKALGASQVFYMMRMRFREWYDHYKENCLAKKFGSPYPYANALAIIVFNNKD